MKQIVKKKVIYNYDYRCLAKSTPSSCWTKKVNRKRNDQNTKIHTHFQFIEMHSLIYEFYKIYDTVVSLKMLSFK